MTTAYQVVEDEIIVRYLLVELYRLLGEEGQQIAHLEKLKEFNGESIQSDFLIEMAERQLEEPNEDTAIRAAAGLMGFLGNYRGNILISHTYVALRENNLEKASTRFQRLLGICEGPLRFNLNIKSAKLPQKSGWQYFSRITKDPESCGHIAWSGDSKNRKNEVNDLRQESFEYLDDGSIDLAYDHAKKVVSLCEHEIAGIEYGIDEYFKFARIRLESQAVVGICQLTHDDTSTVIQYIEEALEEYHAIGGPSTLHLFSFFLILLSKAYEQKEDSIKAAKAKEKAFELVVDDPKFIKNNIPDVLKWGESFYKSQKGQDQLRPNWSGSATSGNSKCSICGQRIPFKPSDKILVVSADDIHEWLRSGDPIGLACNKCGVFGACCWNWHTYDDWNHLNTPSFVPLCPRCGKPLTGAQAWLEVKRGN